jgi:hypothetical protein
VESASSAIATSRWLMVVFIRAAVGIER